MRTSLLTRLSTSQLKKLNYILLFTLSVTLTGCLGHVGDINDACDLLSNKRSWYKGLTKASRQWNVPESTILAFIHQESKFNATAKPPRKRLFGIIPTFRPSSAYGYPQALDTTWRSYQQATKNRFAERDDFNDAANFIGWYIHGSRQALNIPVENVSHHYLAYHEGPGGYARGTHVNKKWLLGVADKVQSRSASYAAQLQACEEKLSERRSLFF